MSVTLYSTHCPKCKVVEMKLDKTGINYSTVDNVEDVIKIGEEHKILSAPILCVDGKYMDFSESLKWIKEVQSV